MLITLCLIILGYMIVGKDVKPWMEKLKFVDWKSKTDKVVGKIYYQLTKFYYFCRLGLCTGPKL